MTALYGTDVHLYDDGECKSKALELVEYMKREVESWTKETGLPRSAYTAHRVKTPCSCFAASTPKSLRD
ncbi:hypothetical protein O9929_25245 [Vibrio lentus]|nr:hypothetical protein [Vibrio lentus]